MKNTFKRNTSYLLIGQLLKSVKADITHFAMEIHIQTSDHVVGVEKVAETCISRKCSTCNSFRVASDFTNYGRYRKIRKELLLT